MRYNFIGRTLRRLKGHLPGHPTYHTYIDKNTGDMRSEGCCERTVCTVFTGNETPHLLARGRLGFARPGEVEG